MSKQVVETPEGLRVRDGKPSGVEVERIKAEFIEADSLRVKNIAIVDNSGKQVGILSSTGDGVGLWLTGKKGEMVSIYSVNGQTAIGIYADVSKAADGLDIALFVADGEPVVQFRQKGGLPQSLSLQNIMDSITPPTPVPVVDIPTVPPVTKEGE